MAVVDTDTFKREVLREMRRRGHNVDHVDVTEEPDGTPHVHIHLRGPMWWTCLRWLLLYPLTLPYRALTKAEDQWTWHVVRGHRVGHNVIVGEPDGPMRCWDHYCHTCEVAW